MFIMANEHFNAFISYNSHDKTQVQEIVTELFTYFYVWFDRADMLVGEEWTKQVSQGLQNSDVCAIFVSEHGIGPSQRQEIELARKFNLRLFFVFLPGASPDAIYEELQIPKSVIYVNYTDGIHEPGYEKIISAILGRSEGWDFLVGLRLQKRAAEWAENKSKTLLYSDRDLEESKTWIHTNFAKLDDSSRAFIVASQKLRKQRLRNIGVSAFIVLLLIGSLAVFGFTQQPRIDAAITQAAIQEMTANAANQQVSVQQSTVEAAGTTVVNTEGTAQAANTQASGFNEFVSNTFADTGIVRVGRNPSALAFCGGRLWVANKDDSTIQYIDPETGAASTEIWLDPRPTELECAGDLLWVALSDFHELQAINPDSREIVHTIQLENEPTALLFDGNRLWIAESGFDGGYVRTVDPSTAEMTEPVNLQIGSIHSLAFDGNTIWASSGTSIQSVGNENSRVPIPVIPGDWGNLIFDGRHLWFANTNTIQAVDIASGGADPVSIGNYPTPQPAMLFFDGRYIWITNVNEGTVKIFDGATKSAGRPIPVGKAPSAVAFVNGQLWVANAGDNTVRAINPNTNSGVVKSVQVGNQPSSLAFDGTRVWVANYADNTVQVINSLSLEAGEPIPVGWFPSALAFDGQRIWVANKADDTIQAINLRSNLAVSPPIKVGQSPSALLFDGTYLWVANRSDATIQKVDPNTSKVDPPLALDPNGSPTALAFDGARIWVANESTGNVQSIDVITSEVSDPIYVGKGPRSIATDGNHVWVACDGYLASIQASSGDVERPIYVGTASSVSDPYNPMALYLADNQHLWIAVSDGSVQLYNTYTDRIDNVISIGSFPTLLISDGERLWFTGGANTSSIQYVSIQ